MRAIVRYARPWSLVRTNERTRHIHDDRDPRRQAIPLGKHWRRLVHSAERLGIAITEFRESAVEDSLFAKLVEEGIFDGRAKITFEQEKASELWPAVQGTRTSCSIITGPRRQIAKRFRLGLSPYLVNSRSPLAGLKTTNYLEPTLCFEAAKHEALMRRYA